MRLGIDDDQPTPVQTCLPPAPQPLALVTTFPSALVLGCGLLTAQVTILLSSRCFSVHNTLYNLLWHSCDPAHLKLCFPLWDRSSNPTTEMSAYLGPLPLPRLKPPTWRPAAPLTLWKSLDHLPAHLPSSCFPQVPLVPCYFLCSLPDTRPDPFAEHMSWTCFSVITSTFSPRTWCWYLPYNPMTHINW